MGRISPGPTRWPPGAERRLVPAKSNLKPQTSNLADPADLVSPVVMAKLINDPEIVLVIYGEVEPVWDALQTVVEGPRIAENHY